MLQTLPQCADARQLIGVGPDELSKVLAYFNTRDLLLLQTSANASIARRQQHVRVCWQTSGDPLQVEIALRTLFESTIRQANLQRLQAIDS